MASSLIRILTAVLVLVVLVGSGVQAFAQGITVPTPSASARQLLGFSVSLVEGDIASGPGIDRLPKGPAKALEDLKEFLPYRSYRILDTQWTLGSGPASSRLRGPGAQDYDLTWRSVHIPPDLMSRRVETGTSADRRAISALARAEAERARSLEDASRVAVSAFRLSVAHASGVRYYRSETHGDVASPSAHFTATAPDLINTSFNMELGETVVVGTSRLQGDKALIVLLTAVAR